ncbi:unnamed protein product [Hymenolepis diminuta]|uniref:Uncharacterized protein n=1 Tax=Hymenolepis diminuta TaxID=6216 RepID=A0A564Z1N4_HYMDI|nr:unnamed protein product [Hymenolepis diminuta]VUZ53431.1 unnamed protein product [Hymenolepis diminuta]VUZ53433.1 unnamed protein product [Hymenolepis diminuta]VUZ53435.1 unnamed protein product [Hymenolepis diminuta]
MSLPTSVTFYSFTMPPKHPLLLRENSPLSWCIFTFSFPLLVKFYSFFPHFPLLTKLISTLKSLQTPQHHIPPSAPLKYLVLLSSIHNSLTVSSRIIAMTGPPTHIFRTSHYPPCAERKELTSLS